MAWLEASRCLGIVIFSIFLAVSCERTKDKMYRKMDGAYCFKRLTATDEYGCTSSRSGDTGVLHFILEDGDLTWLTEKADAGPYVVVLSFDYFNSTTLKKLQLSGKVSGLVLTSNKTTTTTSYSPDDTCPNRFSGLDQDKCDSEKWNPAGESLLFINWGFPIIYIDNPNELEFLHDCFITHNAHDLDEQATRSLCSIEITSHMFAAVDTKTCMRRSMMVNNLTPMKFCDPLGDYSIYLPLYPRINEEKDRRVIMVVARLDGSSMFDGLVPGTISPVTGIVSLMTVAYYLNKLTNADKDDNKQPDGNIMFVLLNGESYDYIGSSRLIYDMEHDVFPYKIEPDVPMQSPLLKLKNIGMVVALDQLTDLNIYYHVHDDSKLTNLGKQFSLALRGQINKFNGSIHPSIGKLPPSSVQQFLKADPEIDGFVIGSYDKAYSNQFYHSILDTPDKIDYTYTNGSEPENNSIQVLLADTSLVIARALFDTLFANRKPAEDVKPDPKLVDELLHCYLDTMDCDLFQKATFQLRLPARRPPLYVGVNVNNNTITMLTGSTLALLTGSQVPLNQSLCQNNDTDKVFQYLWMTADSENGTGVCIKTAMNYTLAQSPAFDIEDYKWESNEYSSWTESVWQQMSTRVFLKPSKQHEILTISLGLLVLILSFVVVYFINTKANVLFNHQVLGTGGC